MAINKFLNVGTSWNDIFNWSLGTIPNSSDIAEFDGASNPVCNIDINVNVQGIKLAVGTSTALTQNSTRTITVGGGHFLVEAGSFLGGDSLIDINGQLIVSAGASFKETSDLTTVLTNLILATGTFVKNGGRIVLVAGSSRNVDVNSNPLNELDMNPGASQTITLLSAIIVDALFKITSVSGINAINGFSIKCRGDVQSSDISITGSTFIDIDGSGAQEYSALITNGILPNVRINKPSGTLTLLTDFRIAKDFEYIQGDIDENGFFFICGKANVGDNRTWTLGSYEFDRFMFDGGSSNTTTLVGDLITNVNLIVNSSNKLSGGDVLINGDWEHNDPSIQGTSKFKVLGTIDQFIDITVTVSSLASQKVLINKPSGDWILKSNLTTVSGINFEIQLGTVVLNGFALSLTDTLKINGGSLDGTLLGSSLKAKFLQLDSGFLSAPEVIELDSNVLNTKYVAVADGFTFIHNDGLVKLTGNNHYSWAGSDLQLYDLELDKGSIYNLVPNDEGKNFFSISHNLILTQTGAMNANFKIAGDLVGDLSAGGGGFGELRFNGTLNQAIKVTGKLPGIIADKISGVLTQIVDLTVEASIVWVRGDVDFVSMKKVVNLVDSNTAYLLSTGRIIFYDVFVNKSGASKYRLISALRIQNKFTIADWVGSMDFSGEPIIVGGEVTMGTTEYIGDSELKLSGDDQKVTPAITWSNTGDVKIVTTGAESDFSNVVASRVLREDGGFVLTEDECYVLREGL